MPLYKLQNPLPVIVDRVLRFEGVERYFRDNLSDEISYGTLLKDKINVSTRTGNKTRIEKIVAYRPDIVAIDDHNFGIRAKATMSPTRTTLDDPEDELFFWTNSCARAAFVMKLADVGHQTTDS